eukprot:CAMPEP_0113670738 /NCGR_PEP_ID=MMETSP0038_2-20120614/5308_1 /TAXON_ID=2898 /ORGANISM="Cryptomonas paramecium" /LENGTH=138 /DNA_ID=CAMNT_0000586797 /DNA_START=50 /DNA_END=464 /DNA_ORIENTATION=- /assembly_acc=CAM_ASM_000170
MTAGKPESAGGTELRKGLRVSLYEEYIAVTLHNETQRSLERPQGRRAVQRAGTVIKILPGGFSAVVKWDDGTSGTYFQSVLFSGTDVPKEPVPDGSAEGEALADEGEALHDAQGEALPGACALYPPHLPAHTLSLPFP